MNKKIFINLPVADLEKSVNFYTALGFENEPQFSDMEGKCMVWSESIFVMLLTHDKFNSFAIKPIADTKSSVACLFSLSVESPYAMDQTIAAGVEAGGTEVSELKDYGFMQQRSIEDFDGHTWEIFHMDMSKIPQG